MKTTWKLAGGILVILGVMVLLPAATAADTLSGCDDCGGGTYTLTFNPTPVSSTSTSNTFAVTLTVNTSGYTGSSTAYIDAIALTLSLKNGGNVQFGDATLVSAPGGTADWNQPVFGGLSNAGSTTNCNGSGNAFFCTDVKDSLETAALVPDKVKVGTGIYVWTWNVVVSKTDALVTTKLGDDLKLIYANPADNFDGVQVSDSIGLQTSTTAPEPGTLILFGSGLLGLGVVVRRRLSA